MHEHVVHRRLDRVGVDALRHRQVALRVHVDAQHAVALLGERDGEVQRRRRLGDAALLVGEGDDLGLAAMSSHGSSFGGARARHSLPAITSGRNAAASPTGTRHGSARPTIRRCAGAGATSARRRAASRSGCSGSTWRPGFSRRRSTSTATTEEIFCGARGRRASVAWTAPRARSGRATASCTARGPRRTRSSAGAEGSRRARVRDAAGRRAGAARRSDTRGRLRLPWRRRDAEHPFALELGLDVVDVSAPSADRPRTLVDLGDVSRDDRVTAPASGASQRCRSRAGCAAQRPDACRRLARRRWPTSRTATPPRRRCSSSSTATGRSSCGTSRNVQVGDAPLRAGSVVSRPAGTGISHAIRAGDGGLRMLGYSDFHPSDACFYPRSQKVALGGLGIRFAVTQRRTTSTARSEHGPRRRRPASCSSSRARAASARRRSPPRWAGGGAPRDGATIVAEVAARDDVSRALGATARGRAVRRARARRAALHHISIDPEQALEEYLRDQLPARRWRRLLIASRGCSRYLAAATPGLRELLTHRQGLGARPGRPAHARRAAVRPRDPRRARDRPRRRGPPAPATFAEAARGGPIARQGGDHRRDGRATRARTAVVAVATRAQEMPVNETLELRDALRRRSSGSALDRVVVNARAPARFTARRGGRAEARRRRVAGRRRGRAVAWQHRLRERPARADRAPAARACAASRCRRCPFVPRRADGPRRRSLARWAAAGRERPRARSSAGRRVVICAGSGGVGKTTTSATIAIGLAAARRARLRRDDRPGAAAGRRRSGLDELGNEPRRVDGDALCRRTASTLTGELWAMMLDPKRDASTSSIGRLAPDDETRDEILGNRIYRELSGAVAGSQEFTAMAKLYDLHALGPVRRDRARHAAVAQRAGLPRRAGPPDRLPRGPRAADVPGRRVGHGGARRRAAGRASSSACCGA